MASAPPGRSRRPPAGPPRRASGSGARAGLAQCASRSRGEPLAIAVRASASSRIESSPIARMLARSWLTTTSVAPRSSRSSSIRSSRRRAVTGSRPEDGSSKNSTSGSSAIARASAGALLHAAADLAGQVVLEAAQPDQRELQLRRPRGSPRRESSVYSSSGSATFSARRHRAPERVALVEDADAPQHRRRARSGPARVKLSPS